MFGECGCLWWIFYLFCLGVCVCMFVCLVVVLFISISYEFVPFTCIFYIYTIYAIVLLLIRCVFVCECDFPIFRWRILCLPLVCIVSIYLLLL